MIDNFASGGRRIDLETISRSYPLWRSDTQCCGQAMPVQDQVQMAGLSLYVPLHGPAAGRRSLCFRSVATMGAHFAGDLARRPVAKARRAIAEMKALRPLYQGDFYPLLEINANEHDWCAWQFDRPELGRGFAMVFRRAQSQYMTAQIALRGLDAKANYEMILAETYGASNQPEPSAVRNWPAQDHARYAPASVLVTDPEAVGRVGLAAPTHPTFRGSMRPELQGPGMGTRRLGATGRAGESKPVRFWLPCVTAP